MSELLVVNSPPIAFLGRARQQPTALSRSCLMMGTATWGQRGTPKHSSSKQSPACRQGGFRKDDSASQRWNQHKEDSQESQCGFAKARLCMVAETERSQGDDDRKRAANKGVLVCEAHAYQSADRLQTVLQSDQQPPKQQQPWGHAWGPPAFCHAAPPAYLHAWSA